VHAFIRPVFFSTGSTRSTFCFFTNDREMRTGCPYHGAQTLRSYISVSFSDMGLFRILSLVLLATVFFFSAEKS
jgi:hypothetical protein